MKVAVFVGTRPEVIKMAPVINALRAASFDTQVCASGQHREILDQALEVFSIKPDISLTGMRRGQNLNGLAAQLVADCDAVLSKWSPDWVLVQGDTTTAFCAGLAAFYRGIRVGHVEAGLRTGNLANPFPEEANRCLLARIATHHFAPTIAARKALQREGIAAYKIKVTGNTVVDAINMSKYISNKNHSQSIIEKLLLAANGRKFILITCHRRENIGKNIESLCYILRRMAARYTNFYWIFPVHPNPNVREPVLRILDNAHNLAVIEPVDYLASLWLISKSALIITDSGGIQEEAPSYAVPVVIMRSYTERREGVDAGFATLAGQSPEGVEAAAAGWLDNPGRAERLRNLANPYGDGRAAERIVAVMAGNVADEFDG